MGATLKYVKEFPFSSGKSAKGCCSGGAMKKGGKVVPAVKVKIALGKPSVADNDADDPIAKPALKVRIAPVAVIKGKGSYGREPLIPFKKGGTTRRGC